MSETESYSKEKIQFLYKAIEDAQGIIKFTDTKAGALIGAWFAILGILYKIDILEKINESLTNINLGNEKLSALIVLLLSIYAIICAVKSIWLSFMAIDPKSSPNNHVEINLENEPKNLFYLFSIKPTFEGKYLYFESKKPKLEVTTQDYLDKITHVNEKEIITELIYELQKVSYIRNIKISRVNESIRHMKHFLIVTILFFIYKLGGDVFSCIKLGGNTILNTSINVELFIYLFVAHKIADYLLQTDKQAKNKSDGLVNKYLVTHCLIYTAIITGTAWILLGYISWEFIISIFISHIILDNRSFVTGWCRKIKGMEEIENKVIVEVDQAFHIIVLFIISLIY